MSPRRSVYLDHNATTPLCGAAQRAVADYLSQFHGNPSSIHQAGRHARDLVETARADVAALIGALPEEIVFTSGGTEANNLALQAAAGRPIATTAVEHPSITDALPPDATRLAVDSHGLVDPTDVARAIDPGARLVSVQWTNHETGVMQPIAAIADLCRDRGALLHVDAVQAAAAAIIDVTTLPIDLLTLSAHKLYGPQGVGALFVRRGLDVSPLLRGGHQERARRAGTENVLGIVGFGAAAAEARATRAERHRHLAVLGHRLQQGILQLPDTSVCGAGAPRAPGVVNALFAGAEGDLLVQGLDLEGIRTSTGAACSSGSLEPSPVLIAMGLAPQRARSAVRMSVGASTTDADVDYVLAVLPGVLARVRQHAPIGAA